MTGIIDYCAGNIRSVERALQFLKTEYVISKNPKDLEKADRLIFPGVGEAGFAMAQLKKTGFDLFIKEQTAAGKALLGICLGAQIIFEHSEESDTACLGLLPGKIRRFPSYFAAKNLKIPHMGWNNLQYQNGGSGLFSGVPENTDVYFVHSYYIEPSDTDIITAVTDYGFPVPCAVKKGNIEALQFHPEKSGLPGLRMLAHFTGAEGAALC
ncbi:imidazole glycerol phosphate synthase subunit HisH [Brucepastera parasyntrophica]|uniref:imidazole glycerol phosphate synthase subunit HisH n=1 Tax=Brucepastera parasyntrophica TaxID=2880008 RepID=UPI00210EB43E|nr:imidazole glycerol phosphate synthase subunit HisH [Brucepastera parasyntrophica]ULQ60515.1 imidazole glycerol phosphate synthase subunit HisH [Brucepastera parasyntrophica]